MTEHEATELATQLLKTHQGKGFEVSMPDHRGYDLMRKIFAELGHATGPDGEFFVVKVFASDDRPLKGKVAEKN